MTETTLSPLMAGAVPAGFLVVESGSLLGQRFPLPQAPGALLLGRERICNVRLTRIVTGWSDELTLALRFAKTACTWSISTAPTVPSVRTGWRCEVRFP
jgi:hypothetical protein